MANKKYVKQAELATYRENYKPISCPILGNLSFTPVVDHDHQTGRIRGVISLEGNALLGKVENFYRSRCVNAAKDLPTVLRRMADYLECSQGPLHPVGIRQVTKRFNRDTKSNQLEILSELTDDIELINSCKNSKARTKLYRRLLLED